jgi:hypothetical protein
MDCISTGSPQCPQSRVDQDFFQQLCPINKKCAMASGAYSFQKLGEIVGVDFAIQLSAWAAASALHTEKFYDTTGAITHSTLG